MRIKSQFKRVLQYIVVFELAYLLLVNLALTLPVTQNLINKIKPDKFAVSWEKAWSWYPFRVHARGVSVNGQARGQQWQVEITTASASISLLPLILRKANISAVNGTDIQYFQRPRMKPDKDFSAVLKYFPPIEGRQINDAILTPKKKRKPWRISLEDIHASGTHQIWIYQLKGTIEGELQADLAIQTQSGPFSIENGFVDLGIQSLLINGDKEVLRQGGFKGELAIAPVVFKENKGVKFIPYVITDLEVDADVDSLAFLNLFLGDFHGMKINGAGEVHGRLIMDRGIILPATDLTVSARKLSVAIMSHRVEGEGSVRLDVSADKPKSLKLGILFTKLEAYHEGDASPLISGEGLAISGSGKTSMPMVQNQDPGVSTLELTVPVIRVPDLGLFQRYLPSKWQMKLHGGEAELQAKLKLSETDFKADIHLISDAADIGIKDYRFETDLDLGVSATAPELGSGTIDISGTYIRLGNFSIASKSVAESEKIQTSLSIETGRMELKIPELGVDEAEFTDVPRVLGDYDLGTLLSFADAELEINGSMSDLSWVSVLLKNSHNMTIGGSGKLNIKALLNLGWLAEGSLMEILPDGLDLKILDYHVQGDGIIRLVVTKGGEGPDIELNMDITDASLKRLGEQQAFIKDVVVKLDAIGKSMGFDGPGEGLELHLKIPSAKVTDMAVFNQYFPEDSPLQLIGGKADLIAKIDLRPTSAAGFVKLETRELQARIDNQEVSAGLSVDIKLADGVPKNLEFDISGSSILIDKVRVLGEESSFNDSDWYIKFDLNKGRAVWKKPVRIEAQADIEMKDTRPIVAMVSNQREKNGWLEKMITIENLQGEATFEMANEMIVIPYAFLGSEKLDVGAKASLTRQTNNGVIYLRYKKLKGVLNIEDGKRNFDIIRAREKFDEYRTLPIN